MFKVYQNSKHKPFFSFRFFCTKPNNYIKNPKDVMDTIVQTAKELHSHYGSKNKMFESKAGNKMEFWAKKTRQMYILEGCFNSQKHIIPVKRLRNPEDSIASLRSAKEIPCVIEGREEFKDFDFVVDKTLVHNFTQKIHYKTKPYYIKYKGEEIRCTLSKYDQHTYHKFLKKIFFQRYIPGRPNLLTLPIEIVAQDKNHYLREFDSEHCQYFESIDIWCFNETYLPIIEIDARLITPSRCFRIADLEHFLPDGMFLHRKYDTCRHLSIFSISETWNQILASTKATLDGVEYGEFQRPTDEVDKDGNRIQDELDEDKRLMIEMDEIQKEKDLEKSMRVSNMPLSKASSKMFVQLKKTGADAKALRDAQKSKKGVKNPDEKAKKAKPKVEEEKEE